MKKLNKTEQVLLKMVDRSKYDLWQCPEHGLHATLKSSKYEGCPYKCSNKTSPYKEDPK